MNATTESHANSRPAETAPELEFRMVPIAQLKPASGLHSPSHLLPSNDAIPAPLMLPIIVARSGRNANRYIVVDGVKRLLILKEAGHRKAACGVLTTRLGAKKLGLLRIRLNAGRAFGLEEKLCYVRWMLRHLSRAKTEKVAAGIGISRREIDHLAPLLNARQAVLEAVASGKIQLAVVQTFLCMTAADQNAFLALFDKATLSLQTQREFLQWLTEIAHAEGCTVRSILKAGPVACIARNRTLNWPQRIEKIRKQLFLRRFPRMSQYEALFEKTAKTANPSPKHVRFIPSPFFEKDMLEVRASFTSASDARRVFSALAKISRAQWDRLICPFST